MSIAREGHPDSRAERWVVGCLCNISYWLVCIHNCKSGAGLYRPAGLIHADRNPVGKTEESSRQDGIDACLELNQYFTLNEIKVFNAK